MTSTDLFFERQHTQILDTYWLETIPAFYVEWELRQAGSITDLLARTTSIQLFVQSGRAKRKPQFAPAVFGQRQKLKAAIAEDSHGIHKLRAMEREESPCDIAGPGFVL